MKYVKPDVYVERFQLSEKVAYNTCQDGSITASAQPIKCVINGIERIFTSNTSGCETTVDYGSDYLVYYDGTGNYTYMENDQIKYYETGWYYVWNNGQVSGQPSLTATQFLNYLVGKASSGSAGQSGWHAGPATATIIDAVANS